MSLHLCKAVGFAHMEEMNDSNVTLNVGALSSALAAAFQQATMASEATSAANTNSTPLQTQPPSLQPGTSENTDRVELL